MKISLISFLFVVIFSTFQVFFINKKEENIALFSVTKDYDQDFYLFKKEVGKLNSLFSNQKESIKIEQLRSQISQTRLAFKKVEFIFDYIHTYFNYQYINGGPIPKLANERSEIDVIPPNGLQTLDEIIFSENAIDQLPEIKLLATELKKSVDFIADNHLPLKLTDRQIMEAIRSGIVRVFTLGLTGFDTPGSGNAIEEALVSFQAMKNTITIFEANLKPEAKNKFSVVQSLFDEGIQFLQTNTDFDNFDRMFFLKKIINPIYQALYNFQYLNEIPTIQLKTHAQNYNATNLFEESFLNTNIYGEFSYAPLDDSNRIELGKILFYDPILSKDLKTSCASCHKPNKAFTDGLPKSKTNTEGVSTKRNSLSLIDAGFSSRFFWDMRVFNLEKQVAHVVNDTLEFNLDFYEIANRLNQSKTYVSLFEKSYPGISKKTINRRSISNAIAAYVNSLKSFNSPFDQYVRGEKKDFSQEAINGFNLFMGKAACGTCHFAPVFNGSVPPFYLEAESEVLGITIGLDTINPQLDQDEGRQKNGLRGENLAHLNGSFKTVSIRNIELTAPYMHNGMFASLEEVMTFYNKGGGAGMGLDIPNQTLSPDPLNLSKQEINDLISFMTSLTDTTGMTPQNVMLPTFENKPIWNERASRF